MPIQPVLESMFSLSLGTSYNHYRENTTVPLIRSILIRLVPVFCTGVWTDCESLCKCCSMSWKCFFPGFFFNWAQRKHHRFQLSTRAGYSAVHCFCELFMALCLSCFFFHFVFLLFFKLWLMYLYNHVSISCCVCR